MIVLPQSAPVNRSDSGAETVLLSDAGGLRQFGAYLETLAPGGWSSDRHWHSAEDEFLFVLGGEATVIENEGPLTLAAGDSIAWPHGNPNGHQVRNLGTEPLRYLIVGTRVAEDICTYPDSGRRQVNGLTDWAILAADGTTLRHGPLPDTLLNLPPVWGAAFDPATPLARVQRAAGRVWTSEDSYTHPVLGAGLGPYRHAILGDPGGLSQFGVHLEELPPGGASSFRHWHMAEDEMVLMLEGAATLIEFQETPLLPGQAACWPAGLAIGHCMENRGTQPAVYLTIGTRLPTDTIHYPDHDLITHKDGTARRYTHADGSPRSQGETP